LGNGTVSFMVHANQSSSNRTGTIEIGGQPLTVRQDGASVACSYSLSPASASVDPAGGGSASFIVTATNGCSWTANTPASWIDVAGGSGLGVGSVSLTVAPNPSIETRTGTVTVEGRTFAVTQGGAGPACTYSVSPTAFSFSSAAGRGDVRPGTGSTCSWTVVASDSWLVPSVTSGTGNGPVPFTVKQNNGITNRTATLTVGPWAVTVFQSGKPRRTK
jgi:hypothetical protein